MANYPWFRFYSEALHDRKIAKAAQVAGSERMTIFGCWAAILSIASDSPRRGWLLVTLQERFTKQDIADEFGLPVGTTEKIIAAFLQYEMLGEENGVFFVVNWEKRQFDSDISTERVRKHRAKHKGNVSETPPDTDTDTDTDTEEEEENPPPDDVFRLYETEIGPITPMIADAVTLAEKEFPRDWFKPAFQEAARNNKRSWAYAETILKRWKRDGFRVDGRTNGNGNGIGGAGGNAGGNGPKRTGRGVNPNSI